MRSAAALALASFMALTAGCATTGMGSRTGYGWIAMQKESGEVGHESSTAKKGMACSQSILGIVTTGDSSLEAAKKDGGIKNVSHVDYEYTNIIGVYGKVCTIAQGN